MLGKLFLLFTILSFTELFILVKLASATSFLFTICVILFTGAAGAWLARREGRRVLGGIQTELTEGKVPAGALVDGLCVLIAGIFLMTPGLITDTFGFLLLTPPVRALVKAAIMRRFAKLVDSGKATVFSNFGRGVTIIGGGSGPFAGGFPGAGQSGPRPNAGGSPFDSLGGGRVVDIGSERVGAPPTSGEIG